MIYHHIFPLACPLFHVCTPLRSYECCEFHCVELLKSCFVHTTGYNASCQSPKHANVPPSVAPVQSHPQSSPDQDQTPQQQQSQELCDVNLLADFGLDEDLNFAANVSNMASHGPVRTGWLSLSLRCHKRKWESVSIGLLHVAWSHSSFSLSSIPVHNKCTDESEWYCFVLFKTTIFSTMRTMRISLMT